ncbi:MAG: LysR family transcriptional regulator [Clostridia bacterium]|nr:LysR family transcriptional regulator [Clostridia bacterium]
MTLQQMAYAVKIAETKSINKAAAELYISQPALSGAIRDLEREICTEIFIRTNKGIRITPDGEEFLTYARKICELQNAIFQRFKGNKEL